MASKEQWENEGVSSVGEEENTRSSEPEHASNQGSSIPGELESSQQRLQYTEGGSLIQQCTEPGGRHSPVW